MRRFKIMVLYLICLVLVCSYALPCGAVDAEGVQDAFYSEDELWFDGTETDLDELNHLLLSKLVYDYLDGYEGRTVREYVQDNPDLYAGEIWTDSGITYESLYGKFIGDYEILKIYNNNDVTGFYAVAFLGEAEAVLVFRGSEMFTDEFALDESNDWIGTDFKFALLNELSGQFPDAKAAYDDLRKSLEGKNVSITFAGHSLGGALVCYASVVTGEQGYSFDGACGHVIDLVYFYNYMDIDGFTGIEDSTFCNYTDDTGYVAADIIQHTNAEYMYQLDRKTNLNQLVENTLIPKLSTAGSHIAWSTVGHDENKIYLLDKCVKGEETYTYAPTGSKTLDITKNIVEAGMENIGKFSIHEGLESIDTDMFTAISMGAVKDGRVMLASRRGSVLRAYDGIGVNSSFAVSTVLYGGMGNDKLYGYVADDILIAGGGINVLDGGLGNDTYIIDSYAGSQTIICDAGGEESNLVFRNMGVTDSTKLLYFGNSFKFPDGQTVRLDMNQTREAVKLYSFNDGEFCYLGTLSDFTNHENDSKEYSRILMLDGKAAVTLMDNLGVAGTKIKADGQSRVYQGEEYRAYVCGKKGSESVLILMTDAVVPVVTSDGPIDMAIGKVEADGQILCGKQYNQQFDAYSIDYEDAELYQGYQGDVSIEDSVDAGYNNLLDLLNKIKNELLN
ncbi:MAG: hypothetical protein NC225_01640 [Clostridium sp.]|nr:hypothetical protein [Clostridium sp.]MCM1398163.1 hypothetical protein [Clostridium sp.]MCM1461006.1 hypothetical protein [Bacteroides sp.]